MSPARNKAFTLVELLVVIAIVGILVALAAPTLISYRKDDAMTAATRQVLDDVARARQLAIAERTTVYMVFVPTNFWKNGLLPYSNWTFVPPAVRDSETVTQLYAAQWTGYVMFALHGVGDQPGRSFPRNIMGLRTLPQSTFFSPLKFPGGPQSAPQYPAPPALIYGGIDVYSFLTTSSLPFPTADMLASSSPPPAFINVPYIAFNYLGQLVSSDGSVLPYDENIPLAHGSIAYWRDQATKMPIQPPPFQPAAVASIVENPPGNDTGISYNVIHIDRLTGRARLQRQEVL
jgi:prepilin-type N-terminal cleavage/methylation domain-containing protein